MRGLLLGAALAAGIVSFAHADDLLTNTATSIVSATPGPPWLGLSGGVAYDPRSVVGYGSVVLTLNRNLWAEGFQLRADLAGGYYKYTGGSFTNANVGFVQADVLLGYQAKVGRTWISAFVGPDFQDHNNPDLHADIRGDYVGARTILEIYRPIGKNLVFSGFGSYSTILSSYDVSGQLSARISPKLSIGPQLSALGATNFSEIRAGGVALLDGKYGQWSLAAGYSWNRGDASGDGVYALLGFSVALR
jgi:hypothetical protein